MGILFFGLLIAAIPFLLPIASWVSAVRTRKRVGELEGRVQEQAAQIAALTRRLSDIDRAAARTAAPASAATAPAEVAPPTAPAAPRPPVSPPAPAQVTPPPPRVAPPPPPPARPAPAPVAPALPRPLRPAAPPRPAFDWESLVGVKLFSAIAGIALVLAAILFLRYSIEAGWLQPPVRVVIGMLVALGLLVACELKAARRYPATANALDAAAIAILFATFFAAHSLWDLIPATMTFALLAVVAALAVLLSIRRESLFIAVLGLLGGFATPALLSSGENRPIPLFTYLLLLNVALAWVSSRQRWPVLAVLTLVFSAIYEWAWVFRFLGASQLTLAMGIFLLFPVATFATLALARSGAADEEAALALDRTATAGAALPLFFAIYLAAVPAYGAHPGLLFGFLGIVDCGLLAIAVARRQPVLHEAGALTTLLVMATWLALSYAPGGAFIALGATALLALLYLVAPVLLEKLRRDPDAAGRRTAYAAPLLLFAPAVLARIEPGFADPFWLFATVLFVLLIVAARAIQSRQGPLYFVAAFFAVAAQATWSATHMAQFRLGTAVVIYVLFGLVSMGVPMAARRMKRPLEPRGGSGVVLVASLCLLLFLSAGPIAPVALWSLALLLAILNAGLFVESAAEGLPWLSLAGSVVSWVVLARWWQQAGGAVGVIASLTVLTGLALVTLGGYAWASRQSPVPVRTFTDSTFRHGLYLGLVGHLFLLFLVVNPAWAIPPWPWMGTLGVLLLAATAASLVTGTGPLHAASAAAGALVVAAWTATTGIAWMPAALIASGIVSAYALAWTRVPDRGWVERGAAPASGWVLFIGEATAILAVLAGPAPFAGVVAAHVTNLSVLLVLAWRWEWRRVAIWAVAPAAIAALAEAITGGGAPWWHLLALALAMYAVFIVYPLALGSRAAGERGPYVAAILGSVTLFFAARRALDVGGYEWAAGAIPALEAAVMAVLLRQLLTIQAKEERDPGRLALVAGAALAFVTVAIPLQLRHQWITIGWALEAAALAWLYTRISHRGLLATSAALYAAVFARLAMNPEILVYEPRGPMRVVNWYLYAYLACAVAFLAGARWLARTDDRFTGIKRRTSEILPAGAVVLLFLLLNIEIADFYATGPSLMLRFGATVSQDLTYTIGWLAFGMGLLGASIYRHSHAGRVAALVLVAITTFKCFLYDLSSLQGLHRIGSFVGLAISLALISLALQKYVLSKPEASN